MLKIFFQEKQILFLFQMNKLILMIQYFYNFDYCIHYLIHSLHFLKKIFHLDENIVFY